MRPAFLALLAALAPLLLTAPAAAQPAQPLDRLLPEVRRTHPGQFYDADGPHPGANGPHYHLKWMTPDGRIIWYDMDARTGRVVGASPGRDSFDPRGERYQGDRFGERNYAPPPRSNFRGEGGYQGRGYEGHGYGGRGFGGGYGPRGGYDRGGHRGR